MRMFNTAGVLVATAIAALGLVVVGWFDYRATRGELLGLLQQQAVSLRGTVAAAARSNEAAAAAARTQVTERLLDNARLLAELDRSKILTQPLLNEITSRNRLFRAGVFGPDGRIELTSGGRGQPPPGRGFGAAAMLGSLLRGEVTEAVADLHGSWWGGGARLPAGVRRANGGAIILTVDASEIAALEQQTSLDRLVQEIVAGTSDLAYVVLESAEFRFAHGDAPAPPAAGPDAGPAAVLPPSGSEMVVREVEVDGRPVIEFAGSAGLSAADPGVVRLGLRLDGVQRAERRLLARLVASLAAAFVLSTLALGTVWLWQQYGVLSRKHALAEAALRRRDRLSAMGELASTVAHEVRNPLNAIAMSGQRLRREFLQALPQVPGEDRAELQQLLGVVEHETGRINRIVQQFLEYARPPRIAPRQTALAPWIEAVVEATRPMAEARGVRLVSETAGAGDALIDPDQMRQALDNLVRNAIEATPAGGTVTVAARTGARDHLIEVRDTGAGIDAEHLPKIFDLYYTTKADGTGIGLAVSQQIVSGHHGTIEVDSAPGRGTTMTVRVPRRTPEVRLG